MLLTRILVLRLGRLQGLSTLADETAFSFLSFGEGLAFGLDGTTYALDLLTLLKCLAILTFHLSLFSLVEDIIPVRYLLLGDKCFPCLCRNERAVGRLVLHFCLVADLFR